MSKPVDEVCYMCIKNSIPNVIDAEECVPVEKCINFLTFDENGKANQEGWVYMENNRLVCPECQKIMEKSNVSTS